MAAAELLPLPIAEPLVLAEPLPLVPDAPLMPDALPLAPLPPGPAELPPEPLAAEPEVEAEPDPDAAVLSFGWPVAWSRQWVAAETEPEPELGDGLVDD